MAPPQVLAPLPSKRTVFFKPSAAEADATQDSEFRRFVNARMGLNLLDYWELHAWSVENLNEFWKTTWDFTGIIGEREGDILFDDSVPMNEVNPRLIRAKLNFAENMLLSHKNARSNADAIISVAEPDPSFSPSSPEYLDSTFLRKLSFEELYQEVRFLGHSLKAMGVQPGDVVAAFAPSNAEMIVASLAAASIGAIWSSTPSEFGTSAVLERLTQISPKILFTADEYRYAGKTIPIYDKLLTILEALPSVKKVIVVGQLTKDRKPRIPLPNDRKGREWSIYTDVVADGRGAPKEIQFWRGPAMAPLWILFSSGTTGKPKCIVHSAGGMVLSQKMTNTFQNNYRPGDIFLQFSTLGWMMWNYSLGTGANGVTVVAYDGSPLSPQSILFQLVDKYQITCLGISPRFLQVLETAGYEPNKHHSLKSLRAIATAGSVLKGDLYDWVHLNVGQRVWINNGTGGTDICNLFIGSAPSLPTHHAEITCKGLGMDLHAWDDDGKSILDGQGEMVIVKPFPNMPIGFWGDEGNVRYREAYFEAFKQPVWTQGDWIEVHSLTGGVTVFGRSDGVLNPQGVRFGSAEIYSVVEEIKSVEDCLAVAQKLGDGDERVILFVKAMEGRLNESIVGEIRAAIRSKLSNRHVPAKIINCDKIPYTTNGKRLEIPVKKLINGIPYEKLNLSSAEDPQCLRYFVDHPELKLPGKAKL